MCLTYMHPRDAHRLTTTFQGEAWRLDNLIYAAANTAVNGPPVHGYHHRPVLHAINGRPC